MRKIYLSGAISSDPQHKAKFRYAEARLSADNFDVVNPTALSDELRRNFKRLNKSEEPNYTDFLIFDLQHLAQCDAICFLQGWEHSPGAIAEFHFAKACNIPMFFEEVQL